MDPAREIGKLLIIFGLATAILGAFLVLGGKFPFRFGHLPGDIVSEGRRGSFYFPIVSCIALSAVLTLILWIVRFFRR